MSDERQMFDADGYYIPSGRGQFLSMNGRGMTTYAETHDNMLEFCNDFYGQLYNKDRAMLDRFGLGSEALAKSAGFAGYGNGLNGYFNSIYGKRITAGFFMSDNAITALGSKPYGTQGLRIAYEAATYGLDDQGEFQLLGAGVHLDGDIPPSVAMPVGEFDEPTKALPYRFNYGRGLRLLENKDDTIAYRDYMDKMGANYSDYADRSILAPIYTNIQIAEGAETGLSMLDRVISSHSEMNMTEEGKVITDEMVSPWGGYTQHRGSFYPFRSDRDSNIDSNIIDAGNTPLSLDMVDTLWRMCSINWENPNNTKNKTWLMSNIAQHKLGALLRAQNLYLDSVYAKASFNGVQAIDGRDVGFLVNSYNNIIIMRDGNINFDFGSKKVSTSKMGTLKLMDNDHIWMGVLQPVTVETGDNSAYTGKLQEIHVMNSYMDLRADGFIQHGKIVNLPNLE